MRVLTAVIAGLFIPCAATMAWAECPDPASGAGVVRALSPGNKGDVDLILSMSMMPKLLHTDYRTEASRHPACKLTEFEAGSSTYELRAVDTNAGTLRLASPKKKGAPIAELVPVTNIMDAIDASKQGKTASVAGYMLATVSKDDFTGWRLYTGVPNQATLAADMAAALDGKLRPIFRNNSNGKGTQLFVSQ